MGSLHVAAVKQGGAGARIVPGAGVDYTTV